MSSIRLGRGVCVPQAELELRAARSGGPGGQSVNTTDSKVELRWSIPDSAALSEGQRRRLLDRLGPRLTKDGVLILQGSEHKSQHRNRDAVIARFRSIVGEALEPPKQRRTTKVSRGAKRRRLEAKRQRSETKKLRKPPSS